MSTEAEVLRGKARGLCPSVGSLILESLQFGAAFLAEGRSRSMASLFISFRNSGNVLFDAKYVSTIISA